MYKYAIVCKQLILMNGLWSNFRRFIDPATVPVTKSLDVTGRNSTAGVTTVCAIYKLRIFY